MMRLLKIAAVALLLSISSICARAQVDSLVSIKLSENKIDLDTNYIKKFNVINDYTLLGVTYGVRWSSVSFQPSRPNDLVFIPFDVGITYTYYCKMFGYMPYFGLQMGLYYSQDSYRFTKEEGYIPDNILGASQAKIQTIEFPFMAHFHYDFWKMKIMANVGVYGGYRLSIQRSDYYSEAKRFLYLQYENDFHPNENRWDYGIKAGGGLGFMLDPIEIHINCFYKYSWSNLHKPNVNARTMESDEKSKYYYKWSYPTNIVLNVGIYYQISRRVGTKRKELKAEAKAQAEEIYKEMLKSREGAAIIKDVDVKDVNVNNVKLKDVE